MSQWYQALFKNFAKNYDNEVFTQGTGEEVDFRCQDARELEFREPFDLAQLLCEGAFPLMETDEMNFQILKNASSALKPGGKLILTTLNALFPLFHSVKDFLNSGSPNGISEQNTFDLITFRDHSVFTFSDDDGESHTLQCNERYYAPSEISWLLSSLGFCNIFICGCEPGQFSRSRSLTPQDFEMLAGGEKTGNL